MQQKICVLGLGYIGLPTCALLADKGFSVHGVDINSNVVEIINSGSVHIVEPDLDQYVSNAVTSGRFRASTQPASADIFIIAVPTPFHDGYVPNVDYVIEATKSIAGYVQPGNLIILESTSPVGTTELIKDTLGMLGVDTEKINIAHCPERVLPGKIMKELVSNDRIVGGLTLTATEHAAEFYELFVSGSVLKTDARTAEMAKLTENSFRDVNIAFANELSLICDDIDIDVWELIRLANHHPRVNILSPGCGVGGHCIAVDPWFIVNQSPKNAQLIKKSREINDYKSEWVIERVKREALSFELINKRKPVVAILGLTFKPDIDDLRESPALKIARVLCQQPFDSLVVDPNVKNVDNIVLHDFHHAMTKAEIVVILVAHTLFKSFDYSNIQVIDTCGATCS